MTADRPQEPGWLSIALDAFATAMQDGDKEAGREARWAIASRLSVVEAENARLSEDAKRLDWLLSHSWCGVFEVEQWSRRGHRLNMDATREAIDAMIAADSIITRRAALVSPPAGSPPNE